MKVHNPGIPTRVHMFKMKVDLPHGAFNLPIEGTQFTKRIHSSRFLTEGILFALKVDLLKQ